MSQKYSCSGCGLAVIVYEGQTIKACKCDSPVIANMSAEAHGSGGLNV
jgi:hypothetical protein